MKEVGEFKSEPGSRPLGAVKAAKEECYIVAGTELGFIDGTTFDGTADLDPVDMRKPPHVHFVGQAVGSPSRFGCRATGEKEHGERDAEQNSNYYFHGFRDVVKASLTVARPFFENPLSASQSVLAAGLVRLPDSFAIARP